MGSICVVYINSRVKVGYSLLMRAAGLRSDNTSRKAIFQVWQDVDSFFYLDKRRFSVDRKTG